MKRVFSLASMLLVVSFSYAQCSDLFFSEYIEGSSSNKALEIFNPTISAIDLSDYKIYRFNNGSLAPTDSILISGILDSDSVYIIAKRSCESIKYTGANNMG